MHGLSETVDLGFLLGRRLDQVRLGLYQVQLVFDRDVSVDVEGEFTVDGTLCRVKDAHILHTVLGEYVQQVTRRGRGDLALNFDSHFLVLHDSNDDYESYTLHNGSELIVV